MRRAPIKIALILCTLFLLAGVMSSSASAQSGPTLIIHEIVSSPQTGQETYDVSVFFSLYDGNGKPIRDLTLADVSLTEDDKHVDPTGVEPAGQEPISVAILMDTSRSMRGTKLATAKQAVRRFISTLGTSDQVALISFDRQVTLQSDFTDNHSDVQKKVESLASGTGACLYDALHKGIQISASRPSGRRAIVVLTDGEDELLEGGTCSTHTIEEVINSATQSTTRVPVYTVGFKSFRELRRLARQTGGLYQFPPDEDRLDELFQKLSDQLRPQYSLTYVSIAQPGPHVLGLRVETSKIQEQTTHDFTLPLLPYQLVFITPQEGEEISKETKLSVQVLGQGEPIANVEFFANGNRLGVVTASPYELAWNPSFDSTGATLEVVAYGEAGGELARSSIHVTLTEPRRSITPILVGGTAAVFLAIALALVLIRLRSQHRQQELDHEWEKKVNSQELPSFALGEERTLDAFTTSENALGLLVVLQSDDPAMIGQRIEIAKPVTNLGRKADNDVIFAKDSSVSRHHAAIEERGGSLFLSEVLAVEDGSAKRPAYGTFVNGNQIEDSVLLRDGDEIRLGKRLRLRFERLQSIATDEERTMEQFDSGDDKTLDSGD